MDEQLKRLETLTNRLESVIRQLPAVNNTHENGESTDSIDSSPVIRDYESLINDSLKPFIAVSQKIGGDLTTINEYLTRLFNEQQQFLKQAVQSQKPNDQQLMDAIKPQSNEIEAITCKNYSFYVLFFF